MAPTEGTRTVTPDRAHAESAGPAAQGRNPLARWVTTALIGLGVLVLASLLRGSPHDAGWYIVHVAYGIAVVAFCSTHLGQRITRTVLVAYGLTLTSLTTLAGTNLWNPWEQVGRIALFMENPNLLAADSVVVLLAASVVQPRGPWYLVFPIAAFALVFTGSRTALLALALAWATWSVVAGVSRKTRARAVLVAGVAGGMGSLVMLQVAAETTSPNILFTSTTFAHARWDDRFAEDVRIEATTEPAPVPGARVDRIVGTTHDSRLVLFQSVEVSRPGEPYTASIYLRSALPQTVVLSTQLTRTECDVTSTWTRCVSGPGIGDGYAAAQLRLEVLQAGDRLDVFASGPQLERSNAVSAYAPKGRALLPVHIAGRFSPAELLESRPSARRAATRNALVVVEARPWLGVGIGQINTAARALDSERASSATQHTHNLLLHRLAEDGAIGIAGWVLILASAIAVAWQAYRWDIAPWLLALIVLNTPDMTFFHSGSFFASSAVIGISMHRLRLRNVHRPSTNHAAASEDPRRR